nr:MAG TPA: hypothetical protein [Caudoviricetes sp.]
MSKKRKRHRKEFVFLQKIFLNAKILQKTIDKALKRCYNKSVNRMSRKARRKK